MWYERSRIELGHEKLIDLNLSLVPHAERPDEALRQMHEALAQMTKRKN